ncbi:transporter, LysE family [Rhodovulum sulfidophilum]|uniref:Transporter, LysE family n=1 Tax=Rhodovulum sulfidophilum TaxID=35806 RepID=A0A0D6B6T8_RHOSU|nr:transporter, LysE family [Rhodovulum sulfidophilum]
MLYAGTDLILFLTRGPVRLAITGRTLSDGSAAGVAMDDAFWPPLTIFARLRPAASAIFLTMGMLLNRQAGHDTAADRRLTRPGTPAGFLGCIAAHRPQGVPFPYGPSPGRFDLGSLGNIDIAVIPAISVKVPCLGNLALARVIDRVRKGPTSPRALRQVNRGAGAMPITVGLIIPLA